MKKKEIYLIEDNNNFSLLMKARLENEGYDVQSFSSATHVIPFLRKQKNLPDLIITDLMMPKMNGLELMRVLEECSEYSAIKKIILSAKKNLKDIDHSFKLGSNGFFFKDEDQEILIQKINEIINKKERVQDKKDHVAIMQPLECETVMGVKIKEDSIHIKIKNEIQEGAIIRVKTTTGRSHQVEILCVVEEIKSQKNHYLCICRPSSFPSRRAS